MSTSDPVIGIKAIFQSITPSNGNSLTPENIKNFFAKYQFVERLFDIQFDLDEPLTFNNLLEKLLFSKNVYATKGDFYMTAPFKPSQMTVRAYIMDRRLYWRTFYELLLLSDTNSDFSDLSKELTINQNFVDRLVQHVVKISKVRVDINYDVADQLIASNAENAEAIDWKQFSFEWQKQLLFEVSMVADVLLCLCYMDRYKGFISRENYTTLNDASIRFMRPFLDSKLSNDQYSIGSKLVLVLTKLIYLHGKDSNSGDLRGYAVGAHMNPVLKALSDINNLTRSSKSIGNFVEIIDNLTKFGFWNFEFDLTSLSKFDKNRLTETVDQQNEFTNIHMNHYASVIYEVFVETVSLPQLSWDAISLLQAYRTISDKQKIDQFWGKHSNLSIQTLFDGNKTSLHPIAQLIRNVYPPKAPLSHIFRLIDVLNDSSNESSRQCLFSILSTNLTIVESTRIVDNVLERSPQGIIPRKLVDILTEHRCDNNLDDVKRVLIDMKVTLCSKFLSSDLMDYTKDWKIVDVIRFDSDFHLVLCSQSTSFLSHLIREVHNLRTKFDSMETVNARILEIYPHVLEGLKCLGNLLRFDKGRIMATFGDDVTFWDDLARLLRILLSCTFIPDSNPVNPYDINTHFKRIIRRPLIIILQLFNFDIQGSLMHENIFVLRQYIQPNILHEYLTYLEDSFCLEDTFEVSYELYRLVKAMSGFYSTVLNITWDTKEVFSLICSVIADMISADSYESVAHMDLSIDDVDRYIHEAKDLSNYNVDKDRLEFLKEKLISRKSTKYNSVFNENSEYFYCYEVASFASDILSDFDRFSKCKSEFEQYYHKIFTGLMNKGNTFTAKINVKYRTMLLDDNYLQRIKEESYDLMRNLLHLFRTKTMLLQPFNNNNKDDNNNNKLIMYKNCLLNNVIVEISQSLLDENNRLQDNNRNDIRYDNNNDNDKNHMRCSQVFVELCCGSEEFLSSLLSASIRGTIYPCLFIGCDPFESVAEKENAYGYFEDYHSLDKVGLLDLSVNAMTLFENFVRLVIQRTSKIIHRLNMNCTSEETKVNFDAINVIFSVLRSFQSWNSLTPALNSISVLMTLFYFDITTFSNYHGNQYSRSVMKVMQRIVEALSFKKQDYYRSKMQYFSKSTTLSSTTTSTSSMSLSILSTTSSSQHALFTSMEDWSRTREQYEHLVDLLDEKVEKSLKNVSNKLATLIYACPETINSDSETTACAFQFLSTLIESDMDFFDKIARNEIGFNRNENRLVKSIVDLMATSIYRSSPKVWYYLQVFIFTMLKKSKLVPVRKYLEKITGSKGFWSKFLTGLHQNFELDSCQLLSRKKYESESKFYESNQWETLDSQRYRILSLAISFEIINYERHEIMKLLMHSMGDAITNIDDFSKDFMVRTHKEINEVMVKLIQQGKISQWENSFNQVDIHHIIIEVTLNRIKGYRIDLSDCLSTMAVPLCYFVPQTFDEILRPKFHFSHLLSLFSREMYDDRVGWQFDATWNTNNFQMKENLLEKSASFDNFGNVLNHSFLFDCENMTQKFISEMEQSEIIQSKNPNYFQNEVKTNMEHLYRQMLLVDADFAAIQAKFSLLQSFQRFKQVSASLLNYENKHFQNRGKRSTSLGSSYTSDSEDELPTVGIAGPLRRQQSPVDSSVPDAFKEKLALLSDQYNVFGDSAVGHANLSNSISKSVSLLQERWSRLKEVYSIGIRNKMSILLETEICSNICDSLTSLIYAKMSSNQLTDREECRGWLRQVCNVFENFDIFVKRSNASSSSDDFAYSVALTGARARLLSLMLQLMSVDSVEDSELLAKIYRQSASTWLAETAFYGPQLLCNNHGLSRNATALDQDGIRGLSAQSVSYGTGSMRMLQMENICVEVTGQIALVCLRLIQRCLQKSQRITNSTHLNGIYNANTAYSLRTLFQQFSKLWSGLSDLSSKCCDDTFDYTSWEDPLISTSTTTDGLNDNQIKRMKRGTLRSSQSSDTETKTVLDGSQGLIAMTDIIMESMNNNILVILSDPNPDFDIGSISINSSNAMNNVHGPEYYLQAYLPFLYGFIECKLLERIRWNVLRDFKRSSLGNNLVQRKSFAYFGYDSRTREPNAFTEYWQRAVQFQCCILKHFATRSDRRQQYETLRFNMQVVNEVTNNTSLYIPDYLVDSITNFLTQNERLLQVSLEGVETVSRTTFAKIRLAELTFTYLHSLNISEVNYGVRHPEVLRHFREYSLRYLKYLCQLIYSTDDQTLNQALNSSIDSDKALTDLFKAISRFEAREANSYQQMENSPDLYVEKFSDFHFEVKKALGNLQALVLGEVFFLYKHTMTDVLVKRHSSAEPLYTPGMQVYYISRSDNVPVGGKIADVKKDRTEEGVKYSIWHHEGYLDVNISEKDIKCTLEPCIKYEQRSRASYPYASLFRRFRSSEQGPDKGGFAGTPLSRESSFSYDPYQTPAKHTDSGSGLSTPIGRSSNRKQSRGLDTSSKPAAQSNQSQTTTLGSTSKDALSTAYLINSLAYLVRPSGRYDLSTDPALSLRWALNLIRLIFVELKHAYLFDRKHDPKQFVADVKYFESLVSKYVTMSERSILVSESIAVLRDYKDKIEEFCDELSKSR